MDNTQTNIEPMSNHSSKLLLKGISWSFLTIILFVSQYYVRIYKHGIPWRIWLLMLVMFSLMGVFNTWMAMKSNKTFISVLALITAIIVMIITTLSALLIWSIGGEIIL